MCSTNFVAYLNAHPGERRDHARLAHRLRPLDRGEYASDGACAWPARLEAWLRVAFPRSNVSVVSAAYISRRRLATMSRGLYMGTEDDHPVPMPSAPLSSAAAEHTGSAEEHDAMLAGDAALLDIFCGLVAALPHDQLLRITAPNETQSASVCLHYGVHPALPQHLHDLYERREHFDVLENNVDAIKQFIAEHKS